MMEVKLLGFGEAYQMDGEEEELGEDDGGDDLELGGGNHLGLETWKSVENKGEMAEGKEKN